MDRRTHLRRGGAALVAAVALTLGATTLPAVPASAGGPVQATEKRAAKPRAWSGYRIRSDRTVGGRWIGGLRIGREVVYRVDPSQKRSARSYGGARSVAAYRRAGTGRTARAAYILSRYGTYRYAVQAAAVDAAVSSLLLGGDYRLQGRRTARRIDQARQSAKIRSFARAMLKDAARHAGAPRLGLAVAGDGVGGRVRARIALRDASGRPLAGQTVRLTYPGADVVVVRTDRAGTAQASFAAAQPGRRSVTATVRGLPAWRLAVRSPTRRGASPVAIAGLKSRLSTSRPAVVEVRPVVQVSNPASASRNAPIPGSFTLSGGQPGNRTAAALLYGPFSSPGAATCTGNPAATTYLTVTGNGSYPIPATSAPGAGYYAWGVLVGEDAVNQAVFGCGITSVAVKVDPTVRVVRVDQAVPAGQPVRTKVTVGGIPSIAGYSGTAVVGFYGPFGKRENVRCNDRQKKATVVVNGNGTFTPNAVTFGQTGYYGILVTLPAGQLSTRATSVCLANESVVRIT